MIKATKVWEFYADPQLYGHTISRKLKKAHGSKRSGTIYIVADNQGEAQEVVRGMFKQAGLEEPLKPYVEPTHLVKTALRLLY